MVATGHKNINLKVRNGTSEPVNQWVRQIVERIDFSIIIDDNLSSVDIWLEASWSLSYVESYFFLSFSLQCKIVIRPRPVYPKCRHVPFNNMNHRSGRRTVQPEISPSEHRESPITLKSSPKHLNYQVRSPHYKKRQNVLTLFFRKTMTCPGLLKLTIMFYSVFMIICMQRYEQEIIPPLITDIESYSPPINGHKGYHHHPRVFVLPANNDEDETINFR